MEKNCCKHPSNSQIYRWWFRNPRNILTLFQLCSLVDITLPRPTKSNQCWKNVVYFNVEICNIEQRQTKVAYFKVDVNDVRQLWNNLANFNVEFHNIDQRQNNVLNMTICIKNKHRVKSNEIFWSLELNFFKSKYPEHKHRTTISLVENRPALCAAACFTRSCVTKFDYFPIQIVCAFC